MPKPIHIFFVFLLIFNSNFLQAAEKVSRYEVKSAMRKAAEYYRNKVASHGGYVYFYTLDLKQRWGEGEATKDQIWVEPPGTPTVGMAYLKAYEATKDKFYLDSAQETGLALLYGQLKSGGWTNCIDFDPQGKLVAQYRNGKGGGKNYSTFDDDKTPSAIRFLVRLDQALDFKDKQIHEGVILALDSMLSAQFPNGGFPQGWQAPVKKQPVLKAGYPEYDWRTEGRIKNYWDYYTLNDNLAGDLTGTLIEVYRIYRDEKYLSALKKLGDFLILAQMPEPQPVWAQQYNYEMKPMWARKFEPPAITSSESQDVIDALMKIFSFTGDKKYLEPMPRALAYLKKSLLPDGQLARFYELKTNKPLYMSRKGKVYTLTYDDSDLPTHYSFKVKSKLDKLEKKFQDAQKQQEFPKSETPLKVSEIQVVKIISKLDFKGRWISVSQGERLTGQPKFKPGSNFISSKVFFENIETLCNYLLSNSE